MKRQDYLSWGDFFMGLALLSAQRSKDPSRQVGAVVVDHNKRIVSMGYNGMPFGCSDDKYPWGKVGEWKDTKYPYVVHAEANCILNAHSSVAGHTMYVTLFPCVECAKFIIQSGIYKLYYLQDVSSNVSESFLESCRLARKILKEADVKVDKYTPTCDNILITLR